jgi:hypothetical protein
LNYKIQIFKAFFVKIPFNPLSENFTSFHRPFFLTGGCARYPESCKGYNVPGKFYTIISDISVLTYWEAITFLYIL